MKNSPRCVGLVEIQEEAVTVVPGKGDGLHNHLEGNPAGFDVEHKEGDRARWDVAPRLLGLEEKGLVGDAE